LTFFDSSTGGPFFYENDGKFYVFGVISFGVSCGTPFPSVYTRVSYYLPWIERIVWPQTLNSRLGDEDDDDDEETDEEEVNYLKNEFKEN